MRSALTTMFQALRHRNYRRWATADFVSVTGAWMQNLGLNWLVLTKTGSASLLGLSLLFQAVPALLLGPWAGTVADRWPARRVLVVTQSLHVLLALALAGAAMWDAPLAVIYGSAVLTGLVTVFDGPALGRFGSQLVPRDTLGNALGLGSILSSGGRILGMSLAGALVAFTGEPMLFVLNAASFAGVIAVICLVREEEMFSLAESPPERSGVKEGARYVLGSGPLLVLFALTFVLSSLGRNYQVTMAAMSEGPLGAGPVGYSVLSVVFAVGTVIGGFLAASRQELTLRLLLVMAVATSVLQAVAGSASNLVVFALVLLPIAAGAVVIDTAASTRMQLDSAEEMRGRVLAAKGMVTAASGAVGGPVLGWLSEHAGPGRALEVAGLATVAATALAWSRFAKMRERRELPAHVKWVRLVDVRTEDPAPGRTPEPAAGTGPPRGPRNPRPVHRRSAGGLRAGGRRARTGSAEPAVPAAAER
ncbi:MFS transporter [Saccharopolyspora sp. 6M]|uniref:MFS transporter n=1 Tax=Saccharopolyspora sp. 6M TaxID=2877237 RepID=UPI001CD32B1B|nr:MFS transporter [Saccharopolyspora sp. 6M]MCA1225829.1 MFS transporter [Saccharopolyspora sp. 6M]